MRYFTLLLFIIFHFVWQSQAEAQCTWPSNAALYQTLTAPTTCIPTIESGCHYFYEYYRINSLVIGNSYTISVRNTTASSPPYEIGIFTSTTIGSTPIAFAQSPTFPMSITFTATTTTVYVIDFYTGCGNTGTNCNYYTVACNNCPTDALATNQPSTSAATQGSINNQVLRIDVPVCANSNITSVTCAEVGTALPSDISAARLYYTTSTTFATTNQFGSQLTIPADGVLTFTGSYNVPTSSKIYFWLVFDVACAATSGLTLDASLTNVIVDGSTRTAPTPNPTGTRSISTLTKSVSTTQNTTANVIPGSSNNDVLRLTVNNCVGTNVSTLNLSTGLSTAPSTDVSNAKVYVTTSTTFNTNILFGTASLPINGAFTVTGSYNLTATTVYFWIVYDISTSPTAGNVVDASCTNIVVDGNTLTPTTSNPAGTRTIVVPPSNDNCANATSLVCNAAAINGTTVNTVAEPSSPPGACSSLYGVWYTFVGDGSTVTISSTAASGFDHEIDLFSGSCGSLTNITCRDGSGSGGTETYNFTSTAGTTYYVYIAYYSSTGTSTQTGTFNISLTCVACAAPTSSAATGITSNSANANWTPTTGNFVIEYGPTATFTPVGTGATAGNPNNFIVTATNVGTIQLTSLSPSTGYSYVIRKDCAASGFSTNSTTQTFTTLITNDDASSAILLPLSSTCTNATLVGATANASEPSISCQGTNGNYTSVWFKFVAPSSGMVKISTDYAVPSVLTDSKLAVYSASNPADYSTFNIIGCDEDNGLTGSGYLSILYVAGLTGGNTYYVKVDKYSSITSAAPFCISVEELVASMLSTNTACPTVSTNTYVDAGTAWSSVIDATGNLIANVKLNGNNLDQIDGSQNINTAAVRQDALGRYYLDRNYLLKVSTQPTTPVGIQLFFKNTELSALTAVDPNATLSNLIVNKQPGTTCNSNFSASNGSVQVLTPTSGSGADLSYVQANVSSFSNFYISSQQSPLPVQLTAFNAVSKDGKTVELTWDVKNENNLSKYELEHSQNGVNFTVIGSVNAASLSKYKYIDENPFNGVNYYRLKIYDHDGKYSLSGVKQVVFQNGKSIVVYPNPTSGNVYFSGLENDGKTSQVSIYNEIGQLVWSNKLMNTELLEKGLEMADYSSGVYIIKIENNISNYTVRIVRQ